MSKLANGVFSLFLLSAVLLSGCSWSGTTRLFTKPIAASPYVAYQEWGPNRNVVVMPFLNVSKDKDASVKCRDLFLAELYISGAFEDIVEEGEMLEVMRKLKIRETEPISKDNLKTLGRNLGAQAVIFGTVEEYTERSNKAALFAVSVRMLDVETGEILWLGNASQEGGGSVLESLGLSDGPVVIDLARDVMEDLISDLSDEVLDNKVDTVEPEVTEDEVAAKQTVPEVADKNIAAPGPQAEAGIKAKQRQRAGITPSPAVQTTSAGMTTKPAIGGN